MKTDRIFVLLLVVMLPMSGCFDDAVGDAEGTEDADGTADTDSNTTVINNYYYNNTTNSQERVWYSTGDIVDARWTDGQPYSSGAARCLEFGPSYDIDTGEYLGEECKEMGVPSSLEDWDSINCSGSLDPVSGGGILGGIGWGYGPNCKAVLATITTNSGEALIVSEMRGLSISSNCDGYEFTASSSHSFDDGLIISGSALNCTHDLFFSQYYTPSNSNVIVQQLVSIVYAIQDTTVV
jgi:hypothetical protein